jgi:hypothetical protein
MRNCPYCAHKNREGSYFCDECARRLSGEGPDATIPTKFIEIATQKFKRNNTTWGTAHFEEEASVVLHIRDVVDPILVKPQKRTILGRVDPTSMQKPDLDLTPYGALEKGVSRLHAAIYRNDTTLTIVDMGSANGTHLNGQRLIPEQPRVLRDGDEVQFGKLVAHIYFKATSTDNL